MKKNILAFAIIFSLFLLNPLRVFAADKISDWKGSEMGAKKNPSWLVPLLKSGNDSKAKNEFDIADDEKLFFVIGIGDEVEDASVDAQLKFKEKVVKELASEIALESEIAKEEITNFVVFLSNFEEVSSFWHEIESKDYVTYKYYQLNKIKTSRWNILKSKLLADIKEKSSEIN